MNEQDLLFLYDGISHLMDAMVLAAQRRDWTDLQSLENRCRPLTARLMASERSVPLSVEGSRQKFEYLKKILADDVAIRRETEPWMDELQTLIRATGTRQKLNHSYLSSRF